MAQHVEQMDVDHNDCDFDKENAYHHGNVLLQASSIEKGYEEMDVSDLNMKLMYPLTPNSSPMSKSLTSNYTENKNSELQDDFSNVLRNESGILSRSLNSSMTKSDKQKIPLQVIPPEQFVERNLSMLHPKNSTVTVEGSDITVKVSGANDAEEDMSFPSSSSSTTAHTPEATTPTKETPKSTDSSIMRGLKSVFNMFRPSQSPIPSGDEGKSVHIPMDISQQSDYTDMSYDHMIVSTPLATHKSESCSAKRNSPHKESLIFNNDLEKELKWNEENVYFNFKEKVPVFPLHTQLFENKMKTCTNVRNNKIVNTEEALDKTVDISNNTITGERTMNEDQTASDSEFLDCETTFTKNDFQLHSNKENDNLKAQLDVQNENETSIPGISNETLVIKIENEKLEEKYNENDNFINTESESNVNFATTITVPQALHTESPVYESLQQEYETNFTSEVHKETLEIVKVKKEQEGVPEKRNESFTNLKIGQELKKLENEIFDIENETTERLISNLKLPAAVPLPYNDDISLFCGQSMDITNESLSDVISDVENFMKSQEDDSLIKETAEIKSNLTYNNITLLSTESKDSATAVSKEVKLNRSEDQNKESVDTSDLKCFDQVTNFVTTQNLDYGDINTMKAEEQYSVKHDETIGEEGKVQHKNEASTVCNKKIAVNVTENRTEPANITIPNFYSKSINSEVDKNKDISSIIVKTEISNQDASVTSEAQTESVCENNEITPTSSIDIISKDNIIPNVNHDETCDENTLSKDVNHTVSTNDQSTTKSSDIDTEIPKEKTEEVINNVESKPLFNVDSDKTVPVVITSMITTDDHTESIKNSDLKVIDHENVDLVNEEITTPENNNVDESRNISSGMAVTDVEFIADEISKKETEAQANITLSPPSPKIISAGQYNFNFDAIDDPFATKTKIRMSPPLEASFSKTNLCNEDLNITTNISQVKNDINKNRRKSQPARKRATGKVKNINNSFDSISTNSNVHNNKYANNKNNVSQEITCSADNSTSLSNVNEDNYIKETPRNKSVTQKSPEKDDPKVLEMMSKSLNKNENNIDMTDEYVEATDNKIEINKNTKVSTVPEDVKYSPALEERNAESNSEVKKNKKSEVSATSKDFKPLPPSKEDFIVPNRSEINEELEIRTKPTEAILSLPTEKQTLESNTEYLKGIAVSSPTTNSGPSLEQLDYCSAGTSAENIISKSVFNLPEIDDKNFNCFVKMSEPSNPKDDAENLLSTGSDTANLLASSDKPIDLEPLDNKKPLENNADSSNSGEEHSTIREVHTEDEDTVEGPFLETNDYDDSAIESDKRDFIQINNVATQKSESDEMFIDAEAFEFLMNQNKENEVADSGKESLFLKFDPLFTRKITSEGVAAALSKIKNNTPKKAQLPQQKDVQMSTPGCSNLKTNPDPFSVNNSLDFIEDPNSTINKPTMAVTPAVNSVVSPRNKVATPTRTNRQSMTFTSPAMAVIDRLLSINSNNSIVGHDSTFQYASEQNQAGFALTQLRELLAEKEVQVHELRMESRDLKDRLDNLESQMRSLVLESESRLRRVNELNERLVEKTNMNKSMATVVEEYEKTIASLIADMEEERRKRAEERVKLMKEKDEQTTHLASMEAAFSDLHSKYEKSKLIIWNYKANEEKCKASLKEFEDSLVKMQNNYDSLKNHATSQLNQANQELEKLNKTHQAEVLKLNALIKRRDLHISSLEETLAQKTKANEELTAICDELINKVG